MGESQVHYRKLSDSGDDSDSSDTSIGIKLSDSGNVSNSSIGVPPSFSRVLEEHGYAIQKELGRGASGRVFLVTNTDGDQCVVKLTDSRDNKEVEILRSLNYGYIVTYVDSFEDEDAGLLYVVMEYCEGGDLHERMQTQKEKEKEKGFFKEQQIIDWLVQICLALKYVHEKNILHRDIKPQNLFLTEDGHINVGDFGCSKTMQRADVYAESVVGAELYKSPEVLKKKYKSKSDIWSLGWVLHDLCMLDMWSDVIERRFLHVNSMRGNPPHISKRYSEELRALIRQMLSRDPKDRPSADEILAKPFLEEAVKRNSVIPEALIQSFMKSIETFDKAYSEHYEDLDAFVKKWGETTDSLMETHRKGSVGSLSGSVIGAAGGITAVVGACLAPFTFGASLIVTGVGVVVGVAGGVTGGVFSFNNTKKQKTLHDSFAEFMKKYEKVSEPILSPLNTLRRILRIVKKFHAFDSASDKVDISCSVGKRKGIHAAELMNLGLLVNVGRIAAQTARVGRAGVAAVAAVTGVLSGLLVLVDLAFIVKDSVDIHQMRKGNVDDPEKVTFSVLKSIAQMRETHNKLCNVLKEIKETREELNDYIDLTRDRKIDGCK